MVYPYSEWLNKARNKFTVAENREYMEKDIIHSVQSSLKSHLLWKHMSHPLILYNITSFGTQLCLEDSFIQ